MVSKSSFGTAATRNAVTSGIIRFAPNRKASSAPRAAEGFLQRIDRPRGRGLRLRHGWLARPVSFAMLEAVVRCTDNEIVRHGIGAVDDPERVESHVCDTNTDYDIMPIIWGRRAVPRTF